VDGENRLVVELKNTAATAALAIKLTLQNASDGKRILPAYLSDNYISLLPGESESVRVDYPSNAGNNAPQIAVRGWNIVPQTIAVSQGAR
jgi:hypothetical protein